MTEVIDTELVGIPNVKVSVVKRAQQYIVPFPEFDMSVSNFYHEYKYPNIRNENAYFMHELGVVMVKPLFANRNNFIESSILPADRYRVEVPQGASPETTEEMERRIFVPKPTLHQRWQGEGQDIINADYKDPDEAPEAGEDYNGPEWREVYHSPQGQGVKRKTTWIHQESSAPDVEWFLVQKGYNFTNQSFWIDVHKHAKVEMDAEDDETGMSGSGVGSEDTFNRYYRYGKKVEAYFAIRVGWQDSSSFSDTTYPNAGRNQGPYDLVFPIDDFPFIWDHGAKDEDSDLDEEELGKMASTARVIYKGFSASEMNREGWILKDDLRYFRIYVYYIRGKMVIKTSYTGDDVWIFPANSSPELSKKTQEKYYNFFIPAGKTCLMGRGFKHRFSYNPLEFNIFTNSGQPRNPSAKITSKPLEERTKYPLGEEELGNYGWQDLVEFKDPDGDYDFSNYTIIPFSNKDDAADGEQETCSFGFDAVSDPFDGISGGSGYTSMMIPLDISVDGAHGYHFDPDGNSSVIWTKTRSPESGERAIPKRSVSYSHGWQITSGGSTAVDFDTKYLDIGLNCRKPTVGPHCANTSQRFASPVLWRVRGKHGVPTPTAQEVVDITPYVKSIRYNTMATDLMTVRQEYKIELIIPKDYPGGNQFWSPLSVISGYQTRENFLRLVAGGVREIRVELGWGRGTVTDPANAASMIRVFTGLSTAGPVNQTYALDTITLDCKDKLTILEDYPIVNSPFYDGMNMEDAFYHICGLSGLPKTMFEVQSERAVTNVLGVGYTFMKPAQRFENGTTLFDAIKRIAKQFWHVIRTDAYGKILLADLHGNDKGALNLIDELPLSNDYYVFYVDGSRTSSPFQRVYGSFNLDKDFSERQTNIEVMSVDRDDPAIIMDDMSYDSPSIEYPDSPDFIGYKKPFRQVESAFGTREKIKYHIGLVEQHVYQFPFKVRFTTYGRPTLRPFDVIQVEFPGQDDQSHYSTYNRAVGEDTVESVKMRVMSVSGTVDMTSEMKYTTEIVAEHR